MKKLWGLLALLALACAGCGRVQSAETAFFAMDTYMVIEARGRDAEKAAAEAEQSVFALENLISRTRENTDIARLNGAEGAEVTVSPETMALLRQAKALAVPGVFDPTIAAVSDLWGINTDGARVPSQEEIDGARATVSIDNLILTGEDRARLRNGARLDLGGIGKGMAADRCAEILRARGIESAMITLGGNIYALGEKADGSPWKIGIADPDGGASFIATLAVKDTSVVTTGDYERYFLRDGVRYHHVFDPATGAPARSGLRSVTVVNRDSTLADARSTALFVLGLEKGLQYCEENGLQAVFITEEREIYVTEGLRDSFTFLGKEAGYVMAA